MVGGRYLLADKPRLLPDAHTVAALVRYIVYHDLLVLIMRRVLRDRAMYDCLHFLIEILLIRLLINLNQVVLFKSYL